MGEQLKLAKADAQMLHDKNERIATLEATVERQESQLAEACGTLIYIMETSDDEHVAQKAADTLAKVGGAA